MNTYTLNESCGSPGEAYAVARAIALYTIAIEQAISDQLLSTGVGQRMGVPEVHAVVQESMARLLPSYPSDYLIKIDPYTEEDRRLRRSMNVHFTYPGLKNVVLDVTGG